MFFLTFLSEPPGSWLYTFGLLAALQVPTGLALQEWWSHGRAPAVRAAGPGPLLTRLALASGSLFILRAVGLLATLLIPPTSSDALIILPPLDRATGALTVLALIWAFAFPANEPRADAVCLGLAILGLAGLVLTWGAWERAVRAGATFFNGSSAETTWVLAIGLLLAAGLWTVNRRRPDGWRAGLGLLALLLLADAFHYLYPLAGSNMAGSLRWAELAAVPLAMLVLFRRALGWPSELSEAAAVPERTRAGLRRRPVWRPLAEIVLVATTVYFVLEFATGRFRVDGPSMLPNLNSGQYVLADKIVYQLGAPQRGDVVVLSPPIAHDQAFIKRLMGLPGDTLTIQDGQVWINAQLATEPYIAAPPNYRGSWTLGPDQYFMLGDNRNDSSDSHVWGSVTRADIIGKALFVYWPPNQLRSVPHYAFAAGR